jgi:hypothetical protein
MEHTIAQVVANLFGIPDWAPKVVWRTAGVALIAAFVLTPSAFREGMTIWVDHETTQIMHRMQPIIDDLMTPPDPATN